ncbi:MAG: hypothetical protein QOD55_1733 [Solirubrobacteraceae bacterium]|jgi:hypothetical protein|nr:hypothetical protein [Solirubrobacteraceae bacterium]
MSLINCEIVMTEGPAGRLAVLVADVPATAAGALADAVRHERNARAMGELDSAAVLAVRAISELADRLDPAPGAGMHVLRLDAGDVAVVCDTAERYVAERDVESYQPPDERARITALRETRDSLRDAQARLMLAGLSAGDPALT